MSNIFQDALSKAGFIDADLPMPKDMPATPAMPQMSTPSSATFTMPSVNLSGADMTAEDQQRLGEMEKTVYGAPSAYIPFRDLRKAMGGTNDVGTVMKMLTAANPGITPDKVRTAVDAHLSIIERLKGDFTGQCKTMQASQVDEPIRKVSELTAQIASLQTEIQQLQSSAAMAKLKIDGGSTHFNTVINELSKPLLETKQLLGNI